jgi:hypothetical protein
MGIPEAAPQVLFEGQMRPDIAAAAIRLLAARGYTVVVVGRHAIDVGQRAAVVDLTARPMSLLIQLFLLSVSRFMVCRHRGDAAALLPHNTPSFGRQRRGYRSAPIPFASMVSSC